VLHRTPVTGTSALVGGVALVALTLVILTALAPAVARSAAPLRAESADSRAWTGVPHPHAPVPTTAPAAVPVTTAAPALTDTPLAAAPPTTHPAPASPRPTTPKTTTPPAPVVSHGILPPDNPAANIAPSPDFTSICRQDSTESPACIAAAEQATTAARGAEGLGAMVLPSNYPTLSPAEQLFVLIDVERVDRGLPPVVGMVPQLDTDAQNAAAANTDPTPVSVPPGTTVPSWASNWAEAAGPLGSNYNWMYDDGPGSGDIGCSAANPGSCWGHRDNELGFNASKIAASHAILVMGAAEVTLASDSPWTSDAVLFALMTGSPTYTYTWAQAQAAGAR
jgi:hypothetical protein